MKCQKCVYAILRYTSELQNINMEALYHTTNRLIQEIQGCFQQLEKNSGDTKSIEDEIQTKINEVNRLIHFNLFLLI